MTDFYGLLGVKRKANDAEIKKAYRRAAQKNHPDRGGDAGAMAAISRAYETLSDPIKRAAYDEHGEEGLDELTQVEKVAVARLKTSMAGMLVQLMQHDLDMSRFIADLRAGVMQGLVNEKQMLAQAKNALARLSKYRGKIRKKLGRGESLVEQVLEEQIKTTEHDIEKLGNAIAVTECAMKIIDGLEYVGEADTRTARIGQYFLGGFISG